MASAQRKFRFLTILTSLAVCGVLHEVVPPTARANNFDDASPKRRSSPAAVVSDLDPIPAEEIAREVLRLQQQMGGSVVENRPNLQGWSDSAGPVTPKEAPATLPFGEEIPATYYQPGIQQPVNKVSELREAAWQLDTTAHRLEKLALYDQADALRKVADRLRHDARAMKPSAQSSVDTGPRPRRPGPPLSGMRQ